MAASGACAAGDGFGFARNTTFNVFYWLQVTNFDVPLFDPAPSGLDYIDVYFRIHAQPPPKLFHSGESWRAQAEKPFDRVRDLMRTNGSPLFEITPVLVRLNHVASIIVNADQQFSDGVISLPDYPLHTLKIRNFYYL